VKSFAYCKAGKAVLLDFRAFSRVSGRASELQLVAKAQKDLVKLKRKAPGVAAKRHVKAVKTTFTKVVALGFSVPDGTEPTAAQKAQMVKVSKAFFNAAYDLGVDLGTDGCEPYLKGVIK
jgi:hypothetical protein